MGCCITCYSAKQAKVSRPHFAAFVQLKQLTSSAANYKPYRQHYTAREELDLPRIPALHIVLRDLASMQYASPSTETTPASDAGAGAGAGGSEDKETDSEKPVSGNGEGNDHNSKAVSESKQASNGSKGPVERRVFFGKFLAESSYVEQVRSKLLKATFKINTGAWRFVRVHQIRK